MCNEVRLNLKEIVFRYNCVGDIDVYKTEERDIVICHSRLKNVFTYFILTVF